jgi:hypothetical protein
MEKSIIQNWIDALRSGKYKKVKGYLHKDDKFSAWGVLHDLYVKSVGSEYKWEYNNTQQCWCIWHYYYDCPCSIVLEWSGLWKRYDLPSNEWFGEISEMNEQGCTFNQIADYIEMNIN